MAEGLGCAVSSLAIRVLCRLADSNDGGVLAEAESVRLVPSNVGVESPAVDWEQDQSGNGIDSELREKFWCIMGNGASAHHGNKGPKAVPAHLDSGIRFCNQDLKKLTDKQ
ncbi:hypothetical protein DFH08DRAFT_826042 [Mycena albidolilacea]|uniref:Uncharacterized protein n=1 Tax=Mycena albidolilacea TaxID=1033008 RepID=A0AAD6Z136_9AGAR|nr:hypothetical protein DFH08DRAFT_826042 [Mycena albidolilacea]